MSHKKFGPDRFSRFDVYWIQTDRQKYIEGDRDVSEGVGRGGGGGGGRQRNPGKIKVK